MRNNFTKGLVIGSIIGASVGMAMNTGMMMNNRSKKRIKNRGLDIMRKSGALISDVVELFR
ncbi:MAG TPA: YtxH domain-containing protein [Acetivibrio sp.]|nr:YtxH domain-containing protein [Acetivibrio sp.]HPT90539.1 YtxH domain-containing protein [Acetivibrio sp.]HQA57953.1 YtxH domain-containing protein [Acetivibrio sp.]